MTPDEMMKIKPAPIRHRELPEFLLDIARWTYSIVGRFVLPTLEQWELGFMRDTNPDKELAFWLRAAYAFITYHRRQSLPLRADEEEAKLVGQLCAVSWGGEVPGEEGQLIRQCIEAPDGWPEEVTRAGQLKEVPGLRWTPPDHLKDWPRAA